MSAITLAVNFSGTPDADDQRALRQLIFMENQRLAALIPPGTPLPSSTGAEAKSSYLSILTSQVTLIHSQNIVNAKSQAIGSRFTNDQIQTIFANLIDQLNAGATPAQVIAKTV